MVSQTVKPKLKLTTNDNFKADTQSCDSFQIQRRNSLQTELCEELLGTAKRIPTASKNLGNFKKNFQPWIKSWKFVIL